jgi:uncharacterized protein
MKTVRWAQEEGNGIEHLVMDEDEQGAVIESAVAGERGGRAFGLLYRVECDARWHVRRLALKVAGGASLDLQCRSGGKPYNLCTWTDADGTPRHDLDGCIDVDLTATPFTNTLPIRRLNLEPGERHVMRVVYVNAPELTVRAVEQAYTCLVPKRRYRYEGLDTGFTAEISVDGDGLVTDYPGLFRRLS